jgi:hypothetical protein
VKTRFAICLALTAASPAIVSAPASAQALLPPFEITTSVRSMGLEPISPPMRRGARYVLRAIDRRGAEVQVAADALSGRILAVRPVGYGPGPVFAARSYPYYPDETPARGYERQQGYDPQGNYEPQKSYPQGGYQRQGNYDPRGNYDQQGSYERKPPLNPGEPSVIHAPRDNANAAPQPPARTPSAIKPPLPKPRVAAQQAPKPAEPEQAAAPETTATTTTTTTTGATPPPAENPALVAPPVQAFD